MKVWKEIGLFVAAIAAAGLFGIIAGKLESIDETLKAILDELRKRNRITYDD